VLKSNRAKQGNERYLPPKHANDFSARLIIYIFEANQINSNL